VSREIVKAVEWMSGLDPRFAREIRGADPDDVARLEAAQGHPCPEVHRDYLLAMGVHPSWFFVHEIDFRLRALLKWHEDLGSGPGPEHTLIGADRSESQNDFYLETAEGEAPEVVSFPWHPGVNLKRTLRDYRAFQAGSLSELICRVGFELYRLRPQPLQERWHLAGSPAAVEQVDELLHGLGLERLWFSNPRGGYYEHSDAAVRVVSTPGHEPVVIVGATASMLAAIRQRVEPLRGAR